MAVAATANGHRLVTTADAPSGPFTASFWVRVNTDQARACWTWGIGGVTGPATSGYTLQARMDLAGNTWQIAGPPNVNVIIGPTITLVTWYHLAIIGHTGASQPWTLVVNGTAFTGSTAAGGGYVDGPVELLESSDATNTFVNARVAAYKHWSAQLTEAKVASERWTYLPVRQANLWAVAPLLTITAVEDLSGQDHHFTALGAPPTSRGPTIAWAHQRVWRGLPVLAPTGTVRNLTAALSATSTTPVSLLTTVRPLTTSLSGASSTPASLLTTARGLDRGARCH